MRLAMVVMVGGLLAGSVLAQQATPAPQASPSPTPKPGDPTKVNWLYGAYVPKDVPLRALDSHGRVKVWVRSTFTTYGIYAKTALFSLSDQSRNRPPA